MIAKTVQSADQQFVVILQVRDSSFLRLDLLFRLVDLLDGDGQAPFHVLILNDRQAVVERLALGESDRELRKRKRRLDFAI